MGKQFIIHERLTNGCSDIGRHGICRVLLKNNQHFFWILLVPEVPHDITELHQLDDADYLSVCDSIKQFSKWVSARPGVEKVNVAAIGNQVRQLHIHIVGRHSGDIAWPGVIWSCAEKKPYPEDEFITLQMAVKNFVADASTPSS